MFSEQHDKSKTRNAQEVVQYQDEQQRFFSENETSEVNESLRNFEREEALVTQDEKAG